jgi:sigma-B regulation protein RsbU (phosphoserine phosphatase)
MSRPPEARGRSGLLPLFALGLAAFAAGAALALTLLPEWSANGLRDERFFVARYRQIAARAGFQLTSGEPRVSLTAGDTPFRDPRSDRASTLRVEVLHAVRNPGDAQEQILEVVFSPEGRPRRLRWQNFAVSVFLPQDPALYERLTGRLVSGLLAPGESSGASREEQGPGFVVQRSSAVVGGSPGERVQIVISPPYVVEAERLTVGAAGSSPFGGESVWSLAARALAYVALFLAVAGIFLALLVRGQIGLINGAILALVTLLSADLGEALFLQREAWVSYFIVLLSAPGLALWVFLVWSAGESLLRALRPDFTTSLDTLRLGRLGPRGGRALLLGFGYGAGLAGLRLALPALAALLPGISLSGSSLSLPIFSLERGPLGSGISMAAMAALTLALALRFLPERWVLPAASLLAGYMISPFRIDPFAARLAAGAAFAAVLVWIARRHGLTALLAASVTSFLLPAALFSGLHFEWLPGSFVLTVGLSAFLLLFGFVGISRSEEEESGNLPTPAFMRRLTEERRIQHEVDLLARMQEGLLPSEMPRLPGYEIAARSVLASEAGGDLYDFLSDEAGRFWIAAGDVAGHGYSCAIAQAMVKASLLSLVEPEESPASVLRRLDRVLRGVSADHSFTSLALIRLDPATGEAELANAGYPYPLVAEFGRVTEIELPGLPLGRGPSYPYEVRPFQFPSGAALVLCSDGLFEALDRNGNAYGFERAREVLKAMGHRPAVEIVDALLNDLRRHLGPEPAPDDVTVVVVKRG